MSSETKPCLFLSYRRADCPDSVKLLFERLERALPRWEVFYDHRSIPPGEPFPELLRAKVTSAAVVLVLIGPSWTKILLERRDKSGVDHVREEIRLALEAGSLVIPVMIEHGRLPPAEELADFADIAPLRARNALAVRPDPDFDTDLRRLVSEVERLGPPEGTGSILAGRYKLIEKVGEGGMGEIWRAEQTQPRRTVAVKLIKLGMDTREVLARFDAERQALAVMNHPHIARVFDVGTTERGRPFFAMEYVRGLPITTYCDDKRLTPDKRLALFQQVCDAVQHAHQKGIIHRDLKPGNVLVEEQNGLPVPKVIDFGLAKALGTRLTDKSLHTAFDRRVGTLEYMSPEQAAGGAADIDTRTDIYSLGALLYELLAGEPPFSRDELLRAASKAGELEIQRIIRDEDPRRPSVKLSSSASLPAIAVSRQLEPYKLTSILRGDLDWIVMKALEKDRGRRYTSASGFADDVGRYLSGDPVQARPPSRKYLLQKYVRKHRGLIASLTSIALLLIGGIIATSWYAYEASVARDDAELAKSEAIAQKEKADRKSEEALLAERKATDARRETELALEATQATLARSNYLLANSRWNENRVAEAMELLQRVPPKYRKFEWHLDRRLYEGSEVTLYGHQDLVSSVAMSPDGKCLATSSHDQTIRLWNTLSGDEILVLYGHQNGVTSVAFSPDGLCLASGSWDNTVKLWDRQTGAEIRTLSGHSDSVRCVAFSPDGKQLASASDDKTVKLWETQTGNETRSFNGHLGNVISLAFSPDGEQIATGADDFQISIWNTQTGEHIRQLSGHEAMVNCVAFSPDGQQLASGAGNGVWELGFIDNSVKLWDLETGKEIRTLGQHEAPVASIAFSPDGRVLATASLDHRIKLWDVRTKQEARTLVGHQAEVASLAFSPDGNRLATGSWDKTIKLWDVRPVEEIRTIGEHPSAVNGLVFSSDGTKLVSGSIDRFIKLWNPQNGEETRTFSELQSGLATIAISPDGTQLALGGKNQTLNLWALETGELVRTLTGHQDEVISMAFSPDGARLASCSYDDPIKLWDLKTGNVLCTLSGRQRKVNSLAFSPDGAYLASGADDNTIKLWDLDSGKELRTCSGHLDSVTSVAFSPDGTRLASGAWDRTIRLWDPKTGAEIRKLDGHKDPVTSVAFSPEGSRLVSGAYDKTVKLWDPQVGDELRSLSGPQAEVTRVAFSPDGARLASGSQTGMVSLWTARTGEETRTLSGHHDLVNCVACSPDGRMVASGSSDATIWLWDTQSGNMLFTLSSHEGPVTSVAFSPDGTRLASGSWDKTVKLWDVTTGQEIGSFSGHLDIVNSLAFSPDGKRLASAAGNRIMYFGSKDNTIKLWDIETIKEIRTLSGHENPLKGVAFSPDGTRIFSDDVGQVQIAWETESGQQLEVGESKPAPNPAVLSSDGRWLVVPVEKNVLLVDLTFKQQPEERTFRAAKARVDPHWHRFAAETAETANDWYAATFHWAWVLKASRQQEKSNEERFPDAPRKLAAAYANWLAEWQAASAGGEPRPGPESLWPASVRDVLATVQEERAK